MWEKDKCFLCASQRLKCGCMQLREVLAAGMKNKAAGCRAAAGSLPGEMPIDQW